MRSFQTNSARTAALLLLIRVADALPGKHREWARAIVAELEYMRGSCAAFQWLAGGVTAMIGATIRDSWARQDSRNAKAAAIGFILLLIPGYFIAASLLNEVGVAFFFAPIEHWLSHPAEARIFNIISPVVLLGTLLLAFVLNAVPLLHLGKQQEPGEGAANVIQLKLRFWNLAAMVVSCMFTGILLVYAFLENFVLRSNP
jgi:hypothetical protein